MIKTKNSFSGVSLGLLFLVLLAMGCSSSGKYFSGFNKNTKIDSLVLQPLVYVSSVKEGEHTFNKELRDTLSKIMSNEAQKILSDKYLLSTFQISDTVDETQLNHFFSEIEALQPSSDVDIPKLLLPVLNDVNQRYVLITYFKGQYNGYFQPYENFRRSVSMSQMMGGSVIYFPLTGSNLQNSYMRLLLVDKLQNKIIFYNKEEDKRNDPRILSVIATMTASIIKPIYYW